MADKAPDAFRTISEVADWLGVSTHVLRFWEGKFSQIKPVKRAGGRRYYRPSDMELLGGIKVLLHDDGLTVRGVQKVLREQGVKAVAARSQPVDTDAPEAAEPERPDPSAAIFSAPAPARKSSTPKASDTIPQRTADKLPLFSERKLPESLTVSVESVARDEAAQTEDSVPDAPAASEPEIAAPWESGSAAPADEPGGSLDGGSPDSGAGFPEPEPETETPSSHAEPVSDESEPDGSQNAPEPVASDPFVQAEAAVAAPDDAPEAPETEQPHPTAEPAPSEPEPPADTALSDTDAALGSVISPSLPTDPDATPPLSDDEDTEPASATPQDVSAAPQAAPIAPLPEPERSLPERLARLVPGQIPADRLRPLHARLVALGRRMDDAGNAA